MISSKERALAAMIYLEALRKDACPQVATEAAYLRDLLGQNGHYIPKTGRTKYQIEAPPEKIATRYAKTLRYRAQMGGKGVRSRQIYTQQTYH
jgi:hypothetical protein